MSNLVEFDLDDGETIVVEVVELEDGTIPASRGEVLEKASQSFEQGISKILPAAKSVVAQLRKLPTSTGPDEIEVTFGFSLSAEASAIITSASTSANFTVTLRWNNSNKEAK